MGARAIVRTIGFLTLSALLLLSGCAASPAPPERTATPPPEETPQVVAEPPTLTLPRTAGTLHPILGRERTNLTLAPLLWEGLYELDRSFAAQNVLAQSETVSDDGLTWTFTLREGVTFSDGSPLTAQEAAESLLLAKSAESRFAARLAGIQSVQASGARALTVTLTAPNGSLPALLDIPIVKGEREEPLGTGPYVLNGQTLTARSDWWRSLGQPVQTIALSAVASTDALIYDFDTGSVGMVTAALTSSYTPGYAGGYEVWESPGTAMLYLGFRMGGVCADRLVRAAISRGMDRDTVATVLYARHSEAAALPVSPLNERYDGALAERLAYAPREMSALLEQAGYAMEEGALKKDGQVLALDFIVCADNPFQVSAANYMAAELGRAGMEVTLRALSWSEFEKALKAGQFDLYLAECLLTADFDLTPLLDRHGALNYGGYADAETDLLLADLRAARGQARTAAASALYARLAEQLPFAAISFQGEAVLTRWGLITGLTPTRQNPFYGMNWSLLD